MTNASLHLAVPPGRLVRARVVFSWLVAAVLALAVTTIGSASSNPLTAGQPSSLVNGATTHLTAVLDATVSPITATAAAAHSQTPRPVPASSTALTAAAALVLALSMLVGRLHHRRSALVEALPFLRGPPSRLLSR